MPSTGPFLPQKLPQTMRTCVPSSSVTCGNVGGLHFLITRRGHLQRGGKIGPQLEAVHAAGVVALGHFLVDDAAAGGHPLHVAGGDGAVVAHAVAVLDGSGEHVGDGLDAAMRMPGKAGEIVLGNVVAEVVEQQERVEVGGVAEAEGAAQMHAGAFERGLGLDERLTGRMDMGFLRGVLLLMRQRMWLDAELVRNSQLRSEVAPWQGLARAQ